VGRSYHNTGMALKDQGKYNEALVYFQIALKIWIKMLGEVHLK